MHAAVPLYLDTLRWLLQHHLDIIADHFGLDGAHTQLGGANVGSLGAYVRNVTGHLWAMQLLRLRALEPDVHKDMVQAFCSRQKVVLQSSVFGATRQGRASSSRGDDDDDRGGGGSTSKDAPTRAFMDRLANANAVLRVCLLWCFW